MNQSVMRLKLIPLLSAAQKKWTSISVSPLFILSLCIWRGQGSSQWCSLPRNVWISRNLDKLFWAFHGTHEIPWVVFDRGPWCKIRRGVLIEVIVSHAGRKTYPTWGKGKSSSKVPWWGDMLAPRRVPSLQLRVRHWNLLVGRLLSFLGYGLFSGYVSFNGKQFLICWETVFKWRMDMCRWFYCNTEWSSPDVRECNVSNMCGCLILFEMWASHSKWLSSIAFTMAAVERSE